MKRFVFIMALYAMSIVSCQREFVVTPLGDDHDVSTTDIRFRNYDEALEEARNAIDFLYGLETRSSSRPTIKSDAGECVVRPITRNGESNEDPLMYVFNHENNEGFTIIAADKAQSPVIAITEQGNYTYGEPTGVESFDAFMDASIEIMLSSLPDTPTLPEPPLTPDPRPLTYTVVVNEEEGVDPLLVTKWGQSGIYGAYCPNGIAGCAITSIGQIMAYHKHPDYLTMTFDGSNQRLYFDWDDMLLHYSGVGDSNGNCYCGANHIHIGKLLREAGKRADTNYEAPDSSGTTQEGLCDAIPSMGYNEVDYRSFSSVGSVMNNIRGNLNQNMPLIMLGCSNYENGVYSNGHAWVVDGYYHSARGTQRYILNPLYDPSDPMSMETEYILDHSTVVYTNLLHFNWGWNGCCDGWFSLGCYQTNQAEEYDNNNTDNSGNSNFQYNLGVIYNIEPNI